jgi:gentisate 1,2-dioxygenase
MLLPIDDNGRRYGATSPIFNYPYERTREALVDAARGEAPDPHLATTLRYANPIDGGWVMPTMSTWMTHVPAGFETTPCAPPTASSWRWRKAAAKVTVGEETFSFAPRDVVAIPAWSWRSFKASDDCFVFCFSDRVAQEKLGLFREQRGRPD